ncbi:MAG: LysR family transcriptional regulator [Proteobacteria bacterium]|nr:MAG: LysR family transcriptional regulator [Pseudomonadota bacterium]
MRDLNEIWVFAKVAQHQSFSAAAKTLGMPLSTVSRKVADLEERLGLSLLQRTTRRLQLTKAGESYARECADLLQGFEEAEANLKRTDREPEGRLRITVPFGMTNGPFANFLAAFLEKYPRIELDIITSNRFVDLVGENVDLALRMGHLPDSSLVARRLGTSHHFLVATPGFIKKYGQPKDLDDLANFPCLIYETEKEHVKWSFVRGKAQRKINVQGRIKASDLSGLKELAIRGQGITLLPEIYCTSEIQQGIFRHLLPEWSSQASPVHAVYPSRRYPPARLVAFLNELEEWKESHWERLKKA